MPYIVTTTTPVEVADFNDPLPVESHVAVATLDEARDAAIEATGGAFSVAEHNAILAAVAAFTAEGGTVGPLPDGTTIAVEPAGWDRLRDESGWRRAAVVAFNADNRHEVCAAWNREHGGTA